MVSNIECKLTKGTSSVKAYGSFVVGECFKINFTIKQGKNGPFMSLPQRKGKDKKTNEDKYYSEVFVEDKAVYEDLSKKLLEKYEEVAGASNEDSGSKDDTPPGW